MSAETTTIYHELRILAHPRDMRWLQLLSELRAQAQEPIELATEDYYLLDRHDGFAHLYASGAIYVGLRYHSEGEVGEVPHWLGDLLPEAAAPDLCSQAPMLEPFSVEITCRTGDASLGPMVHVLRLLRQTGLIGDLGASVTCFG